MVMIDEVHESQSEEIIKKGDVVGQLQSYCSRGTRPRFMEGSFC